MHADSEGTAMMPLQEGPKYFLEHPSFLDTEITA